MRRLGIALVLALVLIMLSGCWDRREIEERSTLLVMGIDPYKLPTPESDLITLSAQVAIPGGIPLGGAALQGGRTGKETVDTLVSSGPSVGEALSNMQKHLNQKAFLGHLRVISVSEDLAREGLQKHLDAIRRNPEIRRLLWMVITKGDARDVVAFTPKLEQVPAFYFVSMFDNDVRMGRMSNVFFGEFLIRLSNHGEDPVLPYIEVSDKDVKRLGLAVFRDDAMVGVLSPEEEWTLLQARGTSNAAEIVTVELSGGKVVGEIFTRRRLVDVQWQDDHLTIVLSLRLEANIREVLGDVELDTPETLTRVGDAMKRKTEESIEKLIEKTQVWNADIIGLGEFVRAYSPEHWRRLDWREMYPTVDIKVESQVFIRRIGMALSR